MAAPKPAASAGAGAHPEDADHQEQSQHNGADHGEGEDEAMDEDMPDALPSQIPKLAPQEQQPSPSQGRQSSFSQQQPSSSQRPSPSQPQQPNPEAPSTSSTSQNHHPRRPPPADTQPIPGPRAARFQSLFAESLRRTLNRLNYENFASCYPTLASNAPQVLRSIQGQMVALLDDRCKREFDQIMINRDVIAKLNELESLMADAAHRRNESNGAEPPTPPHLLPPTTILRAHLAPHIVSHHVQLTTRLQSTQSANARLREDVALQRAEISALLGAVERASADIDAANAALGRVADELAEESRVVDAELGTV